MEFKTSYIKIQKTARYVSYGNQSSKTKYFWFVLHGSKMTCEQIMYKFREFNPDEHYIVVPEALNRFYLEGFGGDVVASWMTKRDRLKEIDDFSNYLTKLYNQTLLSMPEGCKRITMGFSQGGTTLFRWLHNTNVDVDNILAYSCWIPEDINLMESKTEINNSRIIYTYGEQDQFLTEKRIEQVGDIIIKNKLSVDFEPYEGKHKVDRDQLKFIMKKYF